MYFSKFKYYFVIILFPFFTSCYPFDFSPYEVPNLKENLFRIISNPKVHHNCFTVFNLFSETLFSQIENSEQEIKRTKVGLVLSGDGAKELVTKYSMQMLGVNVGELSVTQTNNNGIVNIEAITDVEVNLLFSYCIKYVQNTVYNQGVLQTAHVETYKNGKLNSTMCMKLEKGAYLIVANGDTIIINDLITYSGSLLYFNEPNEAKSIFKERNAEMRLISPVSEHTYIIKDEKDRELNRYFYEEGILQYATLQYALGNIKLKRVKE